MKLIKGLFAKKQTASKSKIDLKLDALHPLNKQVLKYLGRALEKNIPLLAHPNEVKDPYYEQGSHPEIVERVWDEINPKLPKDRRCLIYGRPALVHPDIGIILAICCGTAYCLRLPITSFKAAQEAGMQTYTKWTYGGDMDTKRDLGEDWVFGGWKRQEIDWCNTIYKQLENPT